MIKDYEKAYCEVLEIIKYFPEEEYNKIPKSEIEFFEENKDKGYNFVFYPEKPLEEQEIRRETYALIVLLYRDYLIDEEKVEKLDKILSENERKYQEELNEKYKVEDMFQNRKKYENVEEKNKNEEISMVEYKENIFKKIVNKILSIFLGK